MRFPSARPAYSCEKPPPNRPRSLVSSLSMSRQAAPTSGHVADVDRPGRTTIGFFGHKVKYPAPAAPYRPVARRNGCSRAFRRPASAARRQPVGRRATRWTMCRTPSKRPEPRRNVGRQKRCRRLKRRRFPPREHNTRQSGAVGAIAASTIIAPHRRRSPRPTGVSLSRRSIESGGTPRRPPRPIPRLLAIYAASTRTAFAPLFSRMNKGTWRNSPSGASPQVGLCPHFPFFSAWRTVSKTVARGKSGWPTSIAG